MNFKLHHRSQIWPTACVCFNKVLLVHILNPLTHMLSVAACYYHGKGISIDYTADKDENIYHMALYR